MGAALGVFLACRPCETRSEIRRVCSDEVVVGLGLTGKVKVMTAVVESIRVPVAGGGGVRAGTALAPGTAGEPGNTAVGRHGMSRSPNIADRYAVVLQPLSPRQRQGVIATLSAPRPLHRIAGIRFDGSREAAGSGRDRGQSGTRRMRDVFAPDPGQPGFPHMPGVEIACGAVVSVSGVGCGLDCRVGLAPVPLAGVGLSGRWDRGWFGFR